MGGTVLESRNLTTLLRRPYITGSSAAYLEVNRLSGAVEQVKTAIRERVDGSRDKDGYFSTALFRANNPGVDFRQWLSGQLKAYGERTEALERFVGSDPDLADYEAHRRQSKLGDNHGDRWTVDCRQCLTGREAHKGTVRVCRACKGTGREWSADKGIQTAR